MPIETCPIWGTQFEAKGHFFNQTRKTRVDHSPRAGGGYVLDSLEVGFGINSMSDQQKALLTTWLIDQRTQGDTQPEITEGVIDYIKARRPLSVHERADRLLKFISAQGRTVADPVWIDQYTHAAFAWSESTEWQEVDYCLSYLLQQGWLSGRGSSQVGFFGTVSIEGYSRIAEREANVNTSQAFVAMWFDDSVKAAYDNGIEPAIEEAGYKAMRIDRKPDVDKIDDEIIAEIRRSRFLVADFTHGEEGARGGVYFEAGFAFGLGIPVIYTCRADMVDKLHFDTRQYSHIVWETPEELREGLKKRILARLVSEKVQVSI